MNESSKQLCAVFLTLTVLSPQFAHAIDCTPIDIELATQSEVDNFQDNHGPGCDTVTGELLIGIKGEEIDEGSNITNLNGLIGLNQIHALRVENNPLLDDIDGLSNITSITTGLDFRYNEALTSLSGMDSLTGFSGSLSIYQNPELVALGTFTVSGGPINWLYIGYCEKLTNVNALSGITAVNQTLGIVDTGLTDLGVFAGVSSVGGNLVIASNNALENVDGLGALENVSGVLTIQDNNVLSDLDGLAALENIGEWFFVFQNNQLANIDGLSSLSRVGGDLWLEDLNALENLDGLGSLSYVGGSLAFIDLPELAEIHGFNSLTHLGSSLSISRNETLREIDGFNALTEIGASLGIGSNANLETLGGFALLTRTGAGLSLSSNSSLTDIGGLASLETVGGSLWITNNASLQNLEYLSNIESIGSSILILGNALISNVDWLPGLTAIDGDLSIRSNPLLSDLNGLADLESIAGDLEIEENQTLSDCEPLASVLDQVDDGDPGPGLPPIPDVGGSAVLRNNSQGCSSLEEIGLLPSMASTMVGSWYDPTRDGTGFMLHAVNDQLAVGYYYGFDNDGERFWLIGVHQGPINWGQSVMFDASNVTGGTFGEFLPEDILESSWGQMTLMLPNCDDGRMTVTGQFPGFFIQGFSSSVIRLEPTAGFACNGPYSQQATDGLTGSWYDPRTSGQGFAVHKIDSLTGVVYFYGFDEVGMPLWLIGVWEGPVNFGSEISLQMNQVTGGTFEVVDPDQITETKWGSLRIRFDDCATAWAELSGEDGTHEFDLTLLAGSEGIDCGFVQ